MYLESGPAAISATKRSPYVICHSEIGSSMPNLMAVWNASGGAGGRSPPDGCSRLLPGTDGVRQNIFSLLAATRAASLYSVSVSNQNMK